MERRRGDLTKVSDLFGAYKKRLIAPESTVIDAFLEIAEDLLHTKISKQQCAYKNSTKTLSIRTPGPVKTEILLRKREILTHLKGRIGEKNAPVDIL